MQNEPLIHWTRVFSCSYSQSLFWLLPFLFFMTCPYLAAPFKITLCGNFHPLFAPPMQSGNQRVAVHFKQSEFPCILLSVSHLVTSMHIYILADTRRSLNMASFGCTTNRLNVFVLFLFGRWNWVLLHSVLVLWLSLSQHSLKMWNSSSILDILHLYDMPHIEEGFQSAKIFTATVHQSSLSEVFGLLGNAAVC